MELILRYLIAKAGLVDYSKYKVNSTLIKNFIDNETLVLMESKEFALDKELEILGSVCDLLSAHWQEHALEKYVEDKMQFEGKFSYQVFEALLPGLATHFSKVDGLSKDEIKDHIKQICIRPEFIAASTRGVKALKRYKDLTALSFSYFGSI